MSFSRSWMVLTIVWAATSIPLAPIIAGAIWNDDFSTTSFLWLLLVSSPLVPLGHEFIHPQRPYRHAILAGAMATAAFLAFVLYVGRNTEEIFWIPVIWICVLGFSDWLFFKAQPTVAAQPSPNENVKDRLRGFAANNIDRCIDGFDANAVEFRKVFLDELPQDTSNVQFGPIPLIDVKDFIATKFGYEAALTAFFIVFQRVFDDPRKSEAYLQLRIHLSKKLSHIRLPDQSERQPILSDTEIKNVWELVNDPKYSRNNDELRLAVVMYGLVVGTQLVPPLAQDKDRETLMLLVKRTLNRMRDCLQR